MTPCLPPAPHLRHLATFPRAPSPKHLTPLAAAVNAALLCAVLGATLSPAAASAQTASAQDPAGNAKTFHIAAGPLDVALGLFGRAAGVNLSYDAALVSGASSPGLNGRYGTQDGLNALLAGSGFDGIAQAGGGFALRKTATATSPAGAATLREVRVTASADLESANGPVRGYVARRSATATKTDTALTEVPQSISVIGREEMDAHGAQDMAQAIRNTPGVSVNMYGPDNRGWEDIMLRGFFATTGNYRDGLAQTPFLPTYYLTEPYGLERVEVLRGPASTTFGQGDAGGIINRISKRPTGEQIREIELQYGSFDRKQLGFDLGGQFGGSTDLSYRLVGVGLDSNDQDEYPDGRKLNRTRTYLAPSLRWQPDADTSLTLLGEYLKSTSAEDPYYISRDHVLTRVKMGEPSFSGIRQDQTSLGYQFEHRLNADWTLRQNARYSRVAMDRRVVWLDSIDADDRTVQRIARTWDDALTQGLVDTSVQGKLRTGALEHTVLAGLDWSQHRGTARRFIGPAPTIDLLTPVYGQAVATPQDPLAGYVQKTRQAGLYLRDQARIGERWVVTLGGRQDQVRSTTDDRLNNSFTTQKDKAFSGHAGVNYLLGNGWAPYLGYSESFQPNSGLDANGQPFKPTRGHQLEAGVKYQPAEANTLFTAAVFDLRKTNIVTYDNLTYDARQIGKQRSRGLEVEAKTELWRGLTATASYTWLDVKVLQSADATEVGKIPPLVPKQMASLWVDYALGGGFGVGGGVNYVGPRQNDESNSSFEGGFTLVDAMLRYEQGPWRFVLNATNLLNRNYKGICYHGECYQGAERAVTLTAKYRF